MRIDEILADVAAGKPVSLRDARIDVADDEAGSLDDLSLVEPMCLTSCISAGSVTIGGPGATTALESGDRFTFISGVAPDTPFAVKAEAIAQSLRSGETVVLSNVRIEGRLSVGSQSEEVLTVRGDVCCADCTIAGNMSFINVTFDRPVSLARVARQGLVSWSNVTFSRGIAIVQ